MAIRISHARVETTGRAAIAAGKGRQAVIQQAQNVQQASQVRREQMQAFQADRELNFRIQKFQADEKNRFETMQFQSFVGEEARRRQMAFDVEKIEMRQRHDFDMLEANKEARNQYNNIKEFKKKQEKERYHDTIDKAVKTGRLDEEQGGLEHTRIDLDLPPSMSQLVRSATKENPLAKFLTGVNGNAEAIDQSATKTVQVRDKKTGKVVTMTMAEYNQLTR